MYTKEIKDNRKYANTNVVLYPSYKRTKLIILVAIN